MLKVFPIQDKEEQRVLCERCGVTFDADLLAYQATVEDRFVGVCQFVLRPEGGIVYDLAPLDADNPDKEALFVMGRAALNFIDLCGVHEAYFDGDVTVPGEKLLNAIGFKPDENGRLYMDLNGFFTTPCKHCAGK
jgi:predicted nucleic-acid-binding Zn-ribbon protein